MPSTRCRMRVMQEKSVVNINSPPFCVVQQYMRRLNFFACTLLFLLTHARMCDILKAEIRNGDQR